MTTSVTNPREDFEINALGTFNVLEAARLNERKPVFLYASTNKVYGGMEDVKVVEDATALALCRPAAGLPGNPAAGFPLALRVFEGHRRPVRTGLCKNLRPAHRRPAPVLHLRAAPVRGGGPGLGGLDDHRGRHRSVRITIYGDGKQIRDIAPRGRPAECL